MSMRAIVDQGILVEVDAETWEKLNDEDLEDLTDEVELAVKRALDAAVVNLKLRFAGRGLIFRVED